MGQNTKFYRKKSVRRSAGYVCGIVAPTIRQKANNRIVRTSHGEKISSKYRPIEV